MATVLAPGARVILSGLLTAQAEEIAEVYARCGINLRDRRDIVDWSTLASRKFSLSHPLRSHNPAKLAMVMPNFTGIMAAVWDIGLPLVQEVVMSDANQRNFEVRMNRISRRQQRLSRGYVMSVNHDGLIIAEPKPRAPSSRGAGCFSCWGER